MRHKRTDDEGKDTEGGRGGTRGGRDRRGGEKRNRAKIGKVDEKRVKAVRVC